ncbi:uncharacterized protein LOC111120613 [Crassostrea virginica]|mmetsp:Transcript_23973/g.38339  ORF Transcript_23973/g.38339 Transcript_23973/m.38339 type:complete len:163 (+) Transcript_23973:139-627(+)|eukprot:CAMPEP_0203745850 /NCGR_PEP_ID=MMETSP0098-20131031/1470_1 /ASSEMBLY_ACC=CAM_ASM_000208 /TAXON_ID=96639 /ORGANISM=" , Strain NY0313808BC1" /LENGTH=162 /DNA_ID=CAMNT_0050633757 /DNA_START=110 /DNA_END=598 /DNA_ORIENTATION=-
MRFLWIALVLVLPLVWTNPIPLADLEEAIDVLLTTVEAHERKIKTLQDEMYNVGDVLEKQAFLLRQLEEVVEDKKDPGYADEIGEEEVKGNKVEEQVLSEEIQKIRNLNPATEANPEEYVTEGAVISQTEVVEPEEESEESTESESAERETDYDFSSHSRFG